MTHEFTAPDSLRITCTGRAVPVERLLPMVVRSTATDRCQCRVAGSAAAIDESIGRDSDHDDSAPAALERPVHPPLLRAGDDSGRGQQFIDGEIRLDGILGGANGEQSGDDGRLDHDGDQQFDHGQSRREHAADVPDAVREQHAEQDEVPALDHRRNDGVMTIRAATAEDIDTIVAMGLRFQALTSYAAHLRATATSLRTLTAAVLANADAAIWLAERGGRAVGMIAVGLYTQPMSGECVGSEICWWMDPEARGGRTALKLLHTAERWAAQQGATIFQMMAPTDAVGAFYERLHYELIERHYMRRLA